MESTSTQVVPNDTILHISNSKDTIQSIEKSTIPKDTSKKVIKHNAPNQEKIDSIKREKTRTKPKK